MISQITALAETARVSVPVVYYEKPTVSIFWPRYYNCKCVQLPLTPDVSLRKSHAKANHASQLGGTKDPPVMHMDIMGVADNESYSHTLC